MFTITRLLCGWSLLKAVKLLGGIKLDNEAPALGMKRNKADSHMRKLLKRILWGEWGRGEVMS